MSIDPKGTAPGLAPGLQVDPKVLNMKCQDPQCDSIHATEIQVSERERNAPAPSQRIYRCVKCGRTTSLAVGGHLNI